MTRAEGARPGIVLDVARTIGPSSSRTHIPFPFLLDSEAETMEIGFSFDPGFLADESRARELIEAGMRVYADSLGIGGPDRWRSHTLLKNLLTLSLDDPSGFRGCAHRFSTRQSIALGKGAATPGFIPGAVEAGQWTATISVHLVVTDRCGFHLQIRAL